MVKVYNDNVEAENLTAENITAKSLIIGEDDIGKNLNELTKKMDNFQEETTSKFLNSADKYLLDRHMYDNNRKKEIDITPLSTPQYVTPEKLVNPRKLYLFDDNFNAVNGLVSLFNNGYTNKWDVVRDI